MNLLKKLSFKCSVSSVQGKDVKLYGKQNMFDSVAETSWNSNEVHSCRLGVALYGIFETDNTKEYPGHSPMDNNTF
ncbi:uncharacterized protein LOC126757258 isoform X4 [Bactrocera neohumeralis]|uniref:uncharacterized protein LOC126757258 isoform X4 n=1 Tax=Bactrocera neohumeralis TaxID=98809 RepID=UPI0021664D76|nr:uncharacterized protein LOC126757258 isoform X4 [Bactrocera neohumeralis]